MAVSNRGDGFVVELIVVSCCFRAIYDLITISHVQMIALRFDFGLKVWVFDVFLYVKL